MNRPNSDSSSATARWARPAVVGKMVASPSMPPAAREQYRKLAARLHHLQSEQGTKVVTVSSAVAGEGKTLTSANLALTLSTSFRRSVLLIDADFRRPSQHEMMGVPLSPGFAEALSAPPGTQPHRTTIGSLLQVVSAGTIADPLSALSSSRLREILDWARHEFDWVLIDTPPIGLLSDAGLIAAETDGVLLVVGAGKTPSAVVQRAVELFGRARILGTVLNGADAHAGFNYGYDQYYNSTKD